MGRTLASRLRDLQSNETRFDEGISYCINKRAYWGEDDIVLPVPLP